MLGYDYRTDNEVDLKGIYIAKVIDRMDPKAMERIRVRVIGVHDMENDNKENSLWANHCAFSKGTSGEIPDVDDFVYVMFLNGHPTSIVWLGWVRQLQG